MVNQHTLELIKNILTPFELSEKEFNIFMYIHQYGPLGVTSIARLAGLPRTTIYHILDKLLDKKLIAISYAVGDKKQYSAINHKDIIHLIDQKKSTLINCETLLQDHYQDFIDLRLNTHKPVVTFHTGKEIESMVYDKITQTDYVDALWDIELGISQYGYNEETVLGLPRVAKKYTRRIFVDSKLARKHAQLHQSTTYKIKFIDPKRSERNDYMLCNDSTMHVSYSNPSDPVGIIIYDAHFYTFQKEMFDTLWNQL